MLFAEPVLFILPFSFKWGKKRWEPCWPLLLANWNIMHCFLCCIYFSLRRCCLSNLMSPSNQVSKNASRLRRWRMLELKEKKAAEWHFSPAKILVVKKAQESTLGCIDYVCSLAPTTAFSIGIRQRFFSRTWFLLALILFIPMVIYNFALSWNIVMSVLVWLNLEKGRNYIFINVQFKKYCDTRRKEYKTTNIFPRAASETIDLLPLEKRVHCLTPLLLFLQWDNGSSASPDVWVLNQGIAWVCSLFYHMNTCPYHKATQPVGSLLLFWCWALRAFTIKVPW